MREALGRIETSDISGKLARAGLPGLCMVMKYQTMGSLSWHYTIHVKRFNLIAESFNVLKVLIVLDGKTLFLFL